MSRALTVEQVDELVALRKSKKLRQRDVAELAGTHERTIRNLEAGRAVDEATIRAVYKALGMPGVARPAAQDDWVLQLVARRLGMLQGAKREAYIDLLVRVSVPPDPNV